MNPILVGLFGVLGGGIIVVICHCLIVLCKGDQARNVSGRERASIMDHARVQVIVHSRYSKECKEDLCAVCLGEFKVGERVRVLTECAHIFHVSCINKWLENHSNCPLCRASTIPPPHVDLSSDFNGISVAESSPESSENM